MCRGASVGNPEAPCRTCSRPIALHLCILPCARSRTPLAVQAACMAARLSIITARRTTSTGVIGGFTLARKSSLLCMVAVLPCTGV